MDRHEQEKKTFRIKLQNAFASALFMYFLFTHLFNSF